MKSRCWVLGWKMAGEADEALQLGDGYRAHLMKVGVAHLFDRIGLAHLAWRLAAIDLGHR